MGINGILSTALSGLNASSQQVGVSAFNVVNANTPGFQPLSLKTSTQVLATQSTGQGTPAGVTARVVQGTGSVDIASELVDQTIAAINYAANATVISTADELVGTLLDISV
jgi:flagellar hook protein FlgE